MKLHTLNPQTSFAQTNPMAFSTGIRLLRCYHHHFTFTAIPSRFTGLRKASSELRFLSSVTPPRKQVRPVSARRKVTEEEVGDEGNGSVILRDRDGNEGGGGGGGERIVPTELHKEATEAYMSYAMSVLLGRALPDVRDGLKPVHRRILYAMHELGLSSKKPYKKCARVVGEVLGKFHPHGDNAVYDSLVRMAQDFSLRSPLIRGHGNFGSIDADPPAAMRYTECRLEALTEAMLLADLEQNTVDFVPNFDNSQKEPSLLPARIPNLLLNGASGIAVGMATNIPPHNLGELVDALSALIHNPEATLQELLEYMPGPDFPTGGIIMGNIGHLLNRLNDPSLAHVYREQNAVANEMTHFGSSINGGSIKIFNQPPIFVMDHLETDEGGVTKSRITAHAPSNTNKNVTSTHSLYLTDRNSSSYVCFL